MTVGGTITLIIVIVFTIVTIFGDGGILEMKRDGNGIHSFPLFIFIMAAWLCTIAINADSKFVREIEAFFEQPVNSYEVTAETQDDNKESGSSIYCTECGRKADADDKYCSECGEAIK